MQWNQSRNSSTVLQSSNVDHLRENFAACKGSVCSPKDFGGIDERAKEHLKYGPCYWGHNDMDYMNPWKDEEKLMEALLPDSH